MLLAIDIETTGLDFNKDKILCIGVYGEDIQSNAKNIQKVYRDIQEFNRDIEGIYSKYDLVGHNFQFDLRFLLKNGVTPDIIHRWKYDTKSLAHLSHKKVDEKYIEEYDTKRRELNKGLPIEHRHRDPSPLSLKVLAPFFLKVDPFWETAGNYDNDEYVLKDCRYTFDLCKLFLSRLDEDQLKFNEVFVIPASKMLLDAELAGIEVDNDEFGKKIEEFSEQESRLRDQLDEQWKQAHRIYFDLQSSELHKEYQEKLDQALLKSKDPEKTKKRYFTLLANAIEKLDRKINFESPKQMTWLLRDHLELPIETFKGEESTGKEVLERLANSGREDVKLFLEWRKVNKIVKSYLPTYQELQYNGKIHTMFNTTGTRTGRLSSSEPNMQQVPPSLFSIFRGPFIKYDYSGIEAALIALYSEDPLLFDVIKKGHSIHDVNCKVFFGYDDPVEEIKEKYPDERYIAKHIGFALFYGAGRKRIMQTFAAFGKVISESKAQEIHENFKENYRQAFEFHKQITEEFKAGQIIKNLMGRPLSIPNPEDAYMKGFNTLVQSSASDICLRAAVKTKKKWEDQGLDASIRLLIHDCIIAKADKDLRRANEIMYETMTGFGLKNSLGEIPLRVEGGISDVWT